MFLRKHLSASITGIPNLKLHQLTILVLIVYRH